MLEELPNLLRIRLVRTKPFYKASPTFHITVAETRRANSGKYVERVGLVEDGGNNLQGMKRIDLDFGRTQYWLARGAQPTEPVATLLGIAGILPSVPRGTRALLQPEQKDLSSTTEACE